MTGCEDWQCSAIYDPWEWEQGCCPLSEFTWYKYVSCEKYDYIYSYNYRCL